MLKGIYMDLCKSYKILLIMGSVWDLVSFPFTCIHSADIFIQSNRLLLSHWPEAPCFWKSPWSGSFWLLDNMRSNRLWWPQQIEPHPDTAAVERGKQVKGQGVQNYYQFKPRLPFFFHMLQIKKTPTGIQADSLMKSYWHLAVCLIYAAISAL